MSGFPRRILSNSLLIGILAAPAFGDLLYTYVGDKFTNTTGIYSPGDRVAGAFVLSDSFVPVNGGAGIQNVTAGVESYAFTDGHQVLTQANSSVTIEVGFNPDGTPVLPQDGSGVNAFWFVSITGSNGSILTEDLGDYQTNAQMGSSEAEILSFCTLQGCFPGGPGTWTVEKIPDHVPESGTTMLLFVGIACVTTVKKFYSRPELLRVR
jgi:hypothetical protein